MKRNRFLIIIHPHFTIPGGAGKMMLELGKRINKDTSVVFIAQKVNPEYRQNYPELIFEDIGGPITSSFLFWLCLPVWRKKTFEVIDRYRKEGEVKILCNTFPANWVGLPYKKANPQVECDWFCQEPSAFIHTEKWRKAIPSPLKRMTANVLSPLLARIDISISRKADKIFANSEFSRENIRGVYGRDAIVIYPGVDVSKFSPLEYSQKENTVLTVARLSKFKNVDLLIRAFSKIKNKQIRLKIIGDGEEKENLLDLASKLGLSERTELISGLTDQEVAEEFAKSKLFVLCSKEEPFGMVPVEALASGTPAIADNSGGPKEIIKDQQTGYLIDDLNEDLLAEYIDQLFSDENKLRILSRNSRGSVINIFDWEISAKKLAEEL